MKTIFTDQIQKSEIVRQYLAGYSMEALGKEYGVDPCTIRNVLLREGIILRQSHKRKTVDETFFDAINTEAKAYFLGLMYADGCILDRKNRSLQLSINLQECDKYILEKFSECISYGGKLHLTKYKNPNCSNAYCLRISSNRLCESLISLGCGPRKSLTLKFPDTQLIPRNLMSHFLRGYFDGDGWVNFSKSKKKPQSNIGFCGTRAFLTSMSEYITEELGLPIRTIGQQKNNRIHHASYGGNIIGLSLFRYLYGGATIFLGRKFEKFKAFRL